MTQTTICLPYCVQDEGGHKVFKRQLSRCMVLCPLEERPQKLMGTRQGEGPVLGHRCGTLGISQRGALKSVLYIVFSLFIYQYPYQVSLPDVRV